ncbi:putative mitochondrial presequence protease protein [Phaeoacremonium minimum UCRPA7]|uniref:Presequence protease, mitochondrial n=1 Tax=Phaeoacremonium minimum (strain UCR-PA7) TaxID=1286976 RepID=R8BEB1_PHAM7|nr:putative mitochondrial presequence protease protein [Phaeoacremonium minimum UCRPA7]EON97638.1 putative mitochondrial presequence protease protein [Phaeoacremonium minimum UCRPA7]
MLRNAAKGARRAVTELSQYPKPGDKLHGFTLLRTKHVPELELTALHLQHDKTGAEHLHIARDDSNNVFSIGFKTNPPDDTGVPHILEHTTLCGSEKYPIRDPFFKMLPRTLSNFMNAFTASDHTFYPFATTNAQDFKNLMSVYLDATLHPLLKETDFTQEGWRIGPENPQALASGQEAKPEDRRLVFKGVVYNEMKGQMSDAGYLFYIRFQDHIFPDINNSGGDPQKITDLTYQQLKQFHDEHYHPSNAKLFTYGDMPLADHLQEINAQLGAFQQIQGDLKVHRPIDLSSGPKEVTLPGPVDPLVDANRQFKTSVSWILGDTSDVVESFSLALVSALLMDGYGSPLYKGLIETGLGIDWSPNTGYDNSGKAGIFSVGLTGVQEADVPKVKNELQAILRDVRDKGFERSKIDGYLQQLELSLKHKTANFGMSLLQRLKPKWFTGVDPFDSLAWNDTIAAFEAELAKGGYLEGLVDKYLLNDNTLTFTMAPSSGYGQELVQEEAERLATKIEEATKQAGGKDEAQKQLEERELLLLAEQGKTNTEDLSCLPSVHVRDIPRQKESVVVRDDITANTKVQWREAPTNGLTYFRAINTLENLPQELRSLIPLFTDSIMRLGTKDMTMEQLEDLIKLKTGGISVGYHSASSPTDYGKATEGLIFTGMALDRNVPAMYDLIRKVVAETNFDSPEAVQQIRQLLQASADGVVNDIASSGHAYARRCAEAGLSFDGYLREQVSGLSQVKLTTSLASRPETDQLEDVIAKLKQIQLLALCGGNLRAALTCGTESVQENSSALSNFISSFAPVATKFPPSKTQKIERNIKSFFPLPYQVYYGALALPTTSYTSPDGAPLQILAQLLTHKHLHHEIREKGGAYGGGAYSRALEGVFGFYSYRDPNPLNTMNIMHNAGQWAVDKAWTDRDLEDAKISVFQGVDAPRSVNEEGMSKFLYGITEEMRQKRREQLLDVTKDQVREVAQKYVVEPLSKDAGSIAFLGEKQGWVDGSWTVNDMNVNGSGPA